MNNNFFLYNSEADFKSFSFHNSSWDADKACIRVDSANEGWVESPIVPIAGCFNQAIVSWNAHTPPGACMTILAKSRIEHTWTKWYTLGIWNTSDCPEPRTSVNGQEDDNGTVSTDVLKLKKEADAIIVKAVLSSTDGTHFPDLKLLSIDAINTSGQSHEILPFRQAWGTELDVPELCQISVPGGEGWCSPTSTAMVLGYWSNVLNRPELTVGITETAKAVYDSAWGGTGNWPFNTAYAGECNGIQAYVTRFSSVAEIEHWIGQSVPVIVSLNYGNLKRKPREIEHGHLMVIRGFTAEGDPIFNDPWAELDKEEKLRKIFKREDLEYAWLGSDGSWGTVYLIYPVDYLKNANPE